MNHPFEQLADLMDGTLDERELAGVQAHLDSCATCRQDIHLATHGARAARSLPVEDPPPDLHRRGVGAGGGRGTPGGDRWGGAGASASDHPPPPRGSMAIGWGGVRGVSFSR